MTTIERFKNKINLIEAMPETDVKAFMDIMDVVDALKSQQKEVEKQLSFEEQKEDIKKRLKATYEAMGAVVTDDQVETAIKNYFSNLYVFKEPKKDLKYIIAKAYVNRNRIGKKYGIPALAVIGLSSVALLASIGINAARQSAYENALNERVSDVCQIQTNIEAKIKELSPIKITQLPKIKETEFNDNLNVSKRNLEDQKDFFKRFCPSDSKNNRGNYQYLEQQLPLVRRESLGVLSHLDKNYDIMSLQRNLVIEKQKLENLVVSIRTIAKEDIAMKKADELYKQAQEYIKIADIQTLENYRGRLKSVEDALLEDYTLFIVGGRKRYPLNNPTHYNYYIIVQAKDRNGIILNKKIKNEETNETELVDKWGERVPEKIYRMVERDKKDNGIIDNNILGKKEKGYLTEKISFIDESNNLLKRIGQITRWKKD